MECTLYLFEYVINLTNGICLVMFLCRMQLGLPPYSFVYKGKVRFKFLYSTPFVVEMGLTNVLLYRSTRNLIPNRFKIVCSFVCLSCFLVFNRQVAFLKFLIFVLIQERKMLKVVRIEQLLRSLPHVKPYCESCYMYNCTERSGVGYLMVDYVPV